MIVRFVSSLTSEEENVFARSVLRAAAALLDLLPIAYSIRIETSDESIFEYSRPAEDVLPLAAADKLRSN